MNCRVDLDPDNTKRLRLNLSMHLVLLNDPDPNCHLLQLPSFPLAWCEVGECEVGGEIDHQARTESFSFSASSSWSWCRLRNWDKILLAE